MVVCIAHTMSRLIAGLHLAAMYMAGWLAGHHASGAFIFTPNLALIGVLPALVVGLLLPERARNIDGLLILGAITFSVATGVSFYTDSSLHEQPEQLMLSGWEYVGYTSRCQFYGELTTCILRLVFLAPSAGIDNPEASVTVRCRGQLLYNLNTTLYIVGSRGGVVTAITPWFTVFGFPHENCTVNVVVVVDSRRVANATIRLVLPAGDVAFEHCNNGYTSVCYAPP